MLIRCRENMLSQLGANLPCHSRTLKARQGILGVGSPEHHITQGLGAAVSGERGAGKT